MITKIKNINQIKLKLSSTSTTTSSTRISLNLSSSLINRIDKEGEEDNKNTMEAINNNNSSQINSTLAVERVFLTNKFYPDSSIIYCLYLILKCIIFFKYFLFIRLVYYFNKQYRCSNCICKYYSFSSAMQVINNLFIKYVSDVYKL